MAEDIDTSTRWSNAGLVASKTLARGAGTVDYYQHHGPPTPWRGFTSWHDIVNR